MVLPAPEVPSQMTEQNFDGIAVSTIEKKARVLPHWCTLGRMARAPPSVKITNQLCERHGIKYAVRRNAAFAGHFHAPMHVIEFSD